MRVFLPPCYDSDTTRRYPVLYLLHGLGSSNEQWDRMGVDETADALIHARLISPLLIVMPQDPTIGQPTVSPFGEAVVDELAPWVDQQFRTRAERAYRAVGGLSRGAAWAIHLGLTEWQTFAVVGAHSLPVFWDDSGLISTWLDTIPPLEMPRLYLDIGQKDGDLASAEDFESELNVRAIPHEWHIFPGYHDENYWRSHLEDYLRWYTQGW